MSLGEVAIMVCEDMVLAASYPSGKTSEATLFQLACTGTNVEKIRAIYEQSVPLENTPSKLNVVLPNQMFCFLCLSWDDSFLNKNSMNEQVRLQFLSVWGDAALTQVRMIDDAPYGANRLVMAMERSDFAELASFARDKGCQLASVKPLLISAWQWASERIAEQDYRFFLVEDHVIYLLEIQKKGVSHVVSLPWEGSWADGIALLLKRAALRSSLNAQSPVASYVLNLGQDTDHGSATLKHNYHLLAYEKSEVPNILQLVLQSKHANALDFVLQRPPIRGVRLLLVVCASLLMLIFAYGMWDSVGKARLAEEKLLQLPPLQAQYKSHRSSDEIKLLDKKIDQTNKIIRQLNIPNGQILLAVSPSKSERVALLALDVKLGKAQNVIVKLSAEATNAEDMAAYTQRLSESAYFEVVYLTRHEKVLLNGNRVYRFTLEAIWKD